MTLFKKVALLAATAASFAALPDSAAQAAGSRSMEIPSAPQRAQSPQDIARSAYNSGIRALRKAEGLEKDAARATTPEKQQKARQKATAAYEKALQDFETAVSHSPTLHEAWNYLGFTYRHLDRYDTALLAYGRALELKPGLPEAVEYRAEAYLALDRLDDARQAYLELFSSSRPLADQLLASMQKYVAERRESPQGLDVATLDAFAKWVDERAAIAQQTASLDTSRPRARWR